MPKPEVAKVALHSHDFSGALLLSRNVMCAVTAAVHLPTKIYTLAMGTVPITFKNKIEKSGRVALKQK